MSMTTNEKIIAVLKTGDYTAPEIAKIIGSKNGIGAYLSNLKSRKVVSNTGRERKYQQKWFLRDTFISRKILSAIPTGKEKKRHTAEISLDTSVSEELTLLELKKLWFCHEIRGEMNDDGCVYWWVASEEELDAERKAAKEAYESYLAGGGLGPAWTLLARLSSQ